MAATVWAVHNTTRYDLSDAEQFGSLKTIVPSDVTPWHRPDAYMKHIERLADEMGPEDFILAVGHPVFIGMAMAVAYQKFGEIKTLVWCKHRAGYEVIASELPDLEWEDDDEDSEPDRGNGSEADHPAPSRNGYRRTGDWDHGE